MQDLLDAEELARSLLDVPELHRRWAHVRAVAMRAHQLAASLGTADQELLVAAAWLHDIGYSSQLTDTGLHSLDGARYLERLQYPPGLCRLVAHHSGARFEAAERGLTERLTAFPREEGLVDDALAAADLTVGPNGDHVTVSERIAEILCRYPPTSPTYRAVHRARQELIEQVQGALQRLAPQT
jgi:putative nucleotidyltransferase with HDIG domain